MKILIIFLQILSSVITITSAYGLWGIPEKMKDFGIEVSQLQVVFYVSLVLTVLSLYIGRKIIKPEIGRDKKSQTQIFGSGNKQSMK